MIRIILGVLIGFVVWFIVWVGAEQMLGLLTPNWFGKYLQDVERALINGTPLVIPPTIAVANLFRGFLTSILAGYVAALVAGENRRSTLILGSLLAVTGIAFALMAWNLVLVWYICLFVLSMIPMTILGGRLRRSN